MWELPPLERAGKWFSFLHNSRLSHWFLLPALQLEAAELVPMAKGQVSFFALGYLKNGFKISLL